MLQSGDFAAGYYQALTYLGIVIILSAIYQFNQISTYMFRTKRPMTPDLPNRREKDDINQTSVIVVSNIHAAPTVMFHKLINYTLHVFSVGDMTVGEILLFVIFIAVNLIYLLSQFPTDTTGAETLSKRCAYLALANAAFVFPLATRNSVFLKLIGIPFERNPTALVIQLFKPSLELQYAFEAFYWSHFSFIFFLIFAWHPISFSSSPSVMDDGVHYGSIHMKVQGGFSRQLYARAQEGAQYSQAPLKMRIDGPYGKTSLDFMRYRTVVLVSGGIGITPMISILRDLVDRQVANMPIVTQAIYFLWVIPDIDAYQWFGSELRELISRAGTLPQNKHILDIKVFLTRSTTTPSSIFFQGRPDFSVFMHDIKRYHGSGDVAVGVCGPAVMLKQVRNAAVHSSDSACLFKVHCETFEL
ncbi:cytochrome b-245 heavy chain [Rhizophagus clarus]|uniref:Cytochrome b-245 heavy chain n=1 Tax=Rhizophagus clarus TaxID=94130 RepID=A0A8H3R5N5_9GLOM|nr:cytochrome b-245 heavy chain [Rhizophagus clarus]